MKLRSNLYSKITNVVFGLVLAAGAGPALFSCAPLQSSGNVATEDVGSVGLALSLGPGVTVSSASYTISNANGFSSTGSVDVSQSSTLSFVVGGLPVGSDYTIQMNATTSDGGASCVGSAAFAVTAHATTAVSIHLTCHEGARTGSVSVNGTLNICPVADGVSANPSDIAVGFPVALTVTAHDSDGGPAPLAYQWTAASGSFSGATSATPTFVCNTPGTVTLTVTVSDGDTTPGCADSLSMVVTCEPNTLMVPGSLVISTSTYDRTVGAVASLAVGSTLAGSATATASATTGNNYVTIWNNESVDASFGVTSPIQLVDIDPTSHQVLSKVTVPPIRSSPASRPSRRWACTSRVTPPDGTWCSSATAGPGSARSTCRTPTRCRGRIRRTR